jgi:hypothetical protein
VPDNLTDGLSERALETIDTVVSLVNDKAVRPAIVGARGVVFGLIILVVGLTVAVFGCVGLFRITNVYLFDHKVWISYLVFGAIFCIVGAFLYAKRGVAPNA